MTTLATSAREPNYTKKAHQNGELGLSLNPVTLSFTITVVAGDLSVKSRKRFSTSVNGVTVETYLTFKFSQLELPAVKSLHDLVCVDDGNCL